MTLLDPAALPEEPKADRAVRLDKLYRLISKCDKWFKLLGLAWITPIWRALAGDNPRGQLPEIWRLAVVPMLAIAGFLALWASLAPMVQTSLGAIPGPVQVWEQAVALDAAATAEGVKEQEFYAKQAAKNAALVAEGKADQVKTPAYTGKPTYYAQIWTSIKTVFAGFLIGTIIAVPLGILAGLSPTANAAINPLVQLFKPVSPLAWLPIVTMVVSAVYTDGDLPKSFIVSAFTVTLCSLWPTLINTSLGGGLDRQGSGQRLARAEAVLVEKDHPAGAALGTAVDFHRAAAVFGRGLDGADCGRNAGAEPRFRQVRLG